MSQKRKKRKLESLRLLSPYIFSIAFFIGKMGHGGHIYYVNGISGLWRKVKAGGLDKKWGGKAVENSDFEG
jgi:hypothetical protein